MSRHEKFLKQDGWMDSMGKWSEEAKARLRAKRSKDNSKKYSQPDIQYRRTRQEEYDNGMPIPGNFRAVSRGDFSESEIVRLEIHYGAKIKRPMVCRSGNNENEREGKERAKQAIC
jgi:hypothetical protein